MSIDEQVKAIIIEHLGIEPAQATADASFVKDLGADSLELAELLLLLEQNFEVRISADIAREIRTVGSAVAHVQKLRGAAPAGGSEQG